MLNSKQNKEKEFSAIKERKRNKEQKGRINYGFKHYPKNREKKSPQWVICSLEESMDNMKSIKQDTQDERIRQQNKMKNEIAQQKKTNWRSKQHYYRNNK